MIWFQWFLSAREEWRPWLLHFSLHSPSLEVYGIVYPIVYYTRYTGPFPQHTWIQFSSSQ